MIAGKACELGVSALVPVITARTNVGRLNIARLQTIASEAAEQCGRLDIPEVRAPVDLTALLADWPAGRRLIVCDESGGGRPIAEALAGADPAAPWAVLVGPEGGFEKSELDAIAKRHIFKRVGLGPRILRAETAAIAALACWQALVGERRP
jgi:16S rRNA (uracil1498-N3)-methyltransferase